MPEEKDLENDSPRASGPSQPLVHQWVLGGITAAASRFIPIPFVDDIVKTRSRQFVVARTLAEHKCTFRSKQLFAIYGDTGGCVSGCIGFVIMLPVKLLLFPIRKIVKLVTAVHGVPMDLIRTVLIAKTVDRCIRLGLIETTDDPNSAAKRAVQATQIRAAFDEAFQGIDWLAVRTALGDAFSQMDGWRRAAIRLAKRAFRGNDNPIDPMSGDDEVNESAKQIEAILRKPETLELLKRFEERFDAALVIASNPA